MTKIFTRDELNTAITELFTPDFALTVFDVDAAQGKGVMTLTYHLINKPENEFTVSVAVDHTYGGPTKIEDYSWALLVSKIKSHRLYNQFKNADNRNIKREDASNKLELKFEKDGYKFRVRMWVDENNQLTATISGLYKTDTMCKSFQQDLFFNRNYYVGEDAVTGITREMIKVAYQFMKGNL